MEEQRGQKGASQWASYSAQFTFWGEVNWWLF